MSSDLIHCIYASAASRELEPCELAVLLQQSQANNERLGLTGMLLHADGSFFQVLEGPADAVDRLYRTIEADARHCQVTRIIREPIHRRHFGDWSMGFCQVSSQELAGLAGVNDFFGKDRPDAGLDAGRAKKLLAAFREGRWRKKIAAAPMMAGA